MRGRGRSHGGEDSTWCRTGCTKVGRAESRRRGGADGVLHGGDGGVDALFTATWSVHCLNTHNMKPSHIKVPNTVPHACTCYTSSTYTHTLR